MPARWPTCTECGALCASEDGLRIHIRVNHAKRPEWVRRATDKRLPPKVYAS